jgi:hypothetical protein
VIDFCPCPIPFSLPSQTRYFPLVYMLRTAIFTSLILLVTLARLFNSFPLDLGRVSRSLNILPESRKLCRSSLMANAASAASIEMLTLDTSILTKLPTRKCPLGPVPPQISPTPGISFTTSIPLQPSSNPTLVSYDEDSLEELGLAGVAASGAGADALAEYMAGNKLLPGSIPSAHCYCGHQFGSFSGQLGDGATLYLGHVLEGGKKVRESLGGVECWRSKESV